MKTDKKLAFSLTVTVVLLAVPASLLLWATTTFAEQQDERNTLMGSDVWAWGMMSAATATGLSSLAAGYAVGKVGTAAAGTLAEKPELFGRLLILVGLAEGIAIYGLIISILILNRLV